MRRTGPARTTRHASQRRYRPRHGLDAPATAQRRGRPAGRCLAGAGFECGHRQPGVVQPAGRPRALRGAGRSRPGLGQRRDQPALCAPLRLACGWIRHRVRGPGADLRPGVLAWVGALPGQDACWRLADRPPRVALHRPLFRGHLLAVCQQPGVLRGAASPRAAGLSQPVRRRADWQRGHQVDRLLHRAQHAGVVAQFVDAVGAGGLPGHHQSGAVPDAGPAAVAAAQPLQAACATASADQHLQHHRLLGAVPGGVVQAGQRGDGPIRQAQRAGRPHTGGGLHDQRSRFPGREGCAAVH